MSLLRKGSSLPREAEPVRRQWRNRCSPASRTPRIWCSTCRSRRADSACCSWKTTRKRASSSATRTASCTRRSTLTWKPWSGWAVSREDPPPLFSLTAHSKGARVRNRVTAHSKGFKVAVFSMSRAWLVRADSEGVRVEPEMRRCLAGGAIASGTPSWFETPILMNI